MILTYPRVVKMCRSRLSVPVLKTVQKARGTVAHRTRGPNGDPLGKVTGAQVARCAAWKMHRGGRGKLTNFCGT